MMNQKKAVDILNHWIVLLDQISQIEIDCEMPPNTITDNLERRQQAIDQIQQLDASLMAVREFRFSDRPDLDTEALDELMEKGKMVSDKIVQTNEETIEIAKEKRTSLLEQLKTHTLSKGYLASNQAPKLRPPVIVDGNA